MMRYPVFTITRTHIQYRPLIVMMILGKRMRYSVFNSTHGYVVSIAHMSVVCV